MPFYFAWVDPTETTFGPEHEVVDEDIFSAEFGHVEGDFASLRLSVRNPRIGLLNASRKVWAWFSFNDGATTTPLFFGRLIGIPSDILQELVMLEFVARPLDYAAAKETLAATMRDLPHYDPIWLSVDERLDPDMVMNARSAAWHIDPVTHALSVSDILEGEDGTVDVTAAKALYDSVRISISGTPINRVKVVAGFNWQQRVAGFVKVVKSVFDHMFLGGAFFIDTFSSGLADAWPKEGASLGGGWFVNYGSATALFDFEVITKAFETKNPVPSPEDMGSATMAVVTNSASNVAELVPPAPDGSFQTVWGLTQYEYQTSYDKKTRELQGASLSSTVMKVVVPLNKILCQLELRFQPTRKQLELVTFDLVADTQSLVSLPDGSEAVIIQFNSVDLDEEIDGVAPIGDVRQRSYITQARGRQSLEYLIGVARAAIRSNARAINIEFELVSMDDWLTTSLRKNATLHDPRLPGGQATGKIIGRKMTMNNGALVKQVTIECAIGKGGAPSPVAGTPSYASADYVGADYQVFTGREDVAVVGDISYTVPELNSGDDGIEFMGVNQRAMENLVTMAFQNPPLSVLPDIEAAAAFDTKDFVAANGVTLHYVSQEVMNAIPQKIQEALQAKPHTVRIVCPPLDGEFLSEYPVSVSSLHIPKQIDLEAASG